MQPKIIGYKKTTSQASLIQATSTVYRHSSKAAAKNRNTRRLAQQRTTIQAQANTDKLMSRQFLYLYKGTVKVRQRANDADWLDCDSDDSTSSYDSADGYFFMDDDIDLITEWTNEMAGDSDALFNHFYLNHEDYGMHMTSELSRLDARRRRSQMRGRRFC